MPERVKSGTGIVLLTLATGQFLMALDSSVMNVSIATVAEDLGTDITGVQTAITAYTLVMAAFMITGGTVGRKIGLKRAFLIGCVVYGTGSFTTSIAPNLTVLLLGWSLLEGLGAVLIMPAIVGLVASNFESSERPRAYGLVASAAAVAIAVGPLIGGVVTTEWSWRWVFAGEVVLVAAILVLGRRFQDAPPERDLKIDPVATVLSALGLGLIVFGVLRSGVWGWVAPNAGAPEWLGLSPVVWLLFLGAAVLRIFMERERRRAARGLTPFLDPELLRVPQLRHGLVSFFFLFFVQMGLFFCIPLYLSVALGLSAAETGARLLPLSLTLLLAAAGIPRWRPNASPRRVVTGGMASLVIGTVALIGRPGRRCRARGRDRAPAPRRPWHRDGGLAAGCGDRLRRPRRALRRGRRPAEHVHQPRLVAGDRVGRVGAGRRAHLRVPDRHRHQPGRTRRGGPDGRRPAGGRGALHLRPAARGRARRQRPR